MSKKNGRVKTPEMDITDNYGKFKLIVGNRNVVESHVHNLMRAMEKNDLFTPITVNQKFEVLDGQHRLEARKRLGLIVPFIVVQDVGLDEIQALNCNQKGWTVLDYMNSYIALGKRDYQIYKWFRDKYKFAHNEALHLLSANKALEFDKKLNKEFRQGDFKVVDIENAKALAELILSFEDVYDGVRRRNFIRAMLFLLSRENFDHKALHKRLQNNPIQIKHVVSIDDYINQLEELYNYKKREKVTLRYSDGKRDWTK